LLRLPSLIDLFSIARGKNHADTARDFKINPITFSAYYRSFRFPDLKTFLGLQENTIAQLQILISQDSEKILSTINKSYLEERALHQIYFSSPKLEEAFKKLAYQILSAYSKYNHINFSNSFSNDDARQLLFDLIAQRQNKSLVSRYLLHKIGSNDGYEYTEYRNLSIDIFEPIKKDISGPLPIGKKVAIDFLKSGLLEKKHINKRMLYEKKLDIPDKIYELKKSTSIDVFMSFVLQHELLVNSKGEISIICDSKFSEANLPTKHEINIGVPSLDD